MGFGKEGGWVSPHPALCHFAWHRVADACSAPLPPREHRMVSPPDGGAAGGRTGTCAKHRSSALASQAPWLQTSGGLLSAEQLLMWLV